MKFIYLLAFASIAFIALAYRRRQVRKRIEEVNLPVIRKVPAGIDPKDDAMCISLKDRTIFTSRGITVVARRKERKF